jgi:hypothetical protein
MSKIRSLPRIAAALTAAMLISSVAATAHETSKRGRLVFADHEQPVLRVLDLDTGEATHQFDLPRPNPAIYGTKGGRYVVINTGDDAGTFRFLDTGLLFESHGDHLHLSKSDVALLDLRVKGDRPAHVVSGHGELALFYDGQRPWERKSEPGAALLTLESLGGKAPAVDVWPSPGPQHGIAVPLGRDQWLMSKPNAIYPKGEDRSASSRPDGFEILQRGKDWKRLVSFNETDKEDASCRLFHGHGSTANTQVFACAEGPGGGFLVVSPSAQGAWSARKLAYPDGRRTSSIVSRDDARAMVGNYGLRSPYDALIRINPAAAALKPGDVFPVPEAQPACRFELAAGGARLANLTPDGKLRVHQVWPDWKEIAVFDAVAPFDCQFGARTAASYLTVIGNSAFVSDPMNGRIREYQLDSLKQGLDMPVGGKPSRLTGGGEPPDF